MCVRDGLPPGRSVLGRGRVPGGREPLGVLDGPHAGLDAYPDPYQISISSRTRKTVLSTGKRHNHSLALSLLGFPV